MLNPTIKSYPSLGQEVQEARLDNGLKVVLLRKPGFQKKYITFSTHYGGMDSVFIRPGETSLTTMPDGIAHFLEHKLFEEPDGTNVLDLVLQDGSQPQRVHRPVLHGLPLLAGRRFRPGAGSPPRLRAASLFHR